MNWKQLKDFCNNLPESELEKNVILWRESDAVVNMDAIRLDEDFYIDPDDSENGCFPEFEMEELARLNPDNFPNGKEHFKKVYDRGHPILHENF